MSDTILQNIAFSSLAIPWLHWTDIAGDGLYACCLNSDVNNVYEVMAENPTARGFQPGPLSAR